MIRTKSPLLHDLMEDILSLTMLLKSQYPAVYAHLDETPVFDESHIGGELKAMQDYRDTLEAQLEEANTEKAHHIVEPPTLR
jgi:hypothetical protein